MNSSTSQPVALIVLDGWGYRAERDGNAIALANTPTWDKLWSLSSKTLLEASGERVGLPEGQIGNSEVGHLNLGAGRVVKQDLVRINDSIEDGSFFNNSALVAACETAKRNRSTLHLMGLLGDGGVHAMDKHLFALVDLATQRKVPEIVLHIMTDGRDALPTSGLRYLKELLNYIGDRARIATVGGRYFGMDRDRRWQRTELFYRAAVEAIGPTATDPIQVIEDAYAQGVTDEFIRPTVIVRDGVPVSKMKSGDSVICFNYRSDRMRQIVETMIDPDFGGFDISNRPQLSVTTLTSYNKEFDVPVAFEPFSMSRIVAEVISDAGKSMLKTAETEKYPHVTYFFNGGIEPPFPGEERILIPSQKVATYDLAPEMSAYGITDTLCRSIEAREHDFTLCNFANADMVGHTGSLPATIKAIEAVDNCLTRIVESAIKAGTRLVITADHGNAEQMIDLETGGPNTAHTTNLVPLVYVDPSDRQPALRMGGALCDVGPTILSMLGIDIPSEMTGIDLVNQTQI